MQKNFQKTFILVFEAIVHSATTHYLLHCVILIVLTILLCIWFYEEKYLLSILHFTDTWYQWKA